MEKPIKLQRFDSRNFQQEQNTQEILFMDSIKLEPLGAIQPTLIKSEKEMNLTWTDLEVKVPNKKSCFKRKEKIIEDSESGEIIVTEKRKSIINKASGYAKAKEVLAIMGASGAGNVEYSSFLKIN